MAGLPSCEGPGDTCKGRALQKMTSMAAEEQVFQGAGAAGGPRTEVAQPSTDEPIKSKYKIPKRRASKHLKKAKQVQNMWNNPKKPPTESRNMVNYVENLFEETQVPEVPRGKAKPLVKKSQKPKFSPVPIHDKLSHYDYKPLSHVDQYGPSSLVLDDIAVGCLESDVEKSARMAESPVLSSLGKSLGCPDAYFQFLCPLYGRNEASKMVLELYPDPTLSYQGSVVHGEDYSDGSAGNTEFGWEDDNFVYTGKYL